MNDLIQTSCSVCKLDIEGPHRGYWTDRGGNSSCAGLDGLGNATHQPWSGDVTTLANRAKLRAIAAPVAVMIETWTNRKVDDANTVLDRFAAQAMPVVALLSEDDPTWAVREKELARWITEWMLANDLTTSDEIPDPQVRQSLRAQIDGNASSMAEYGWLDLDGIIEWLCDTTVAVGDHEFWWLHQYEAQLPQSMLYAAAYYLGWNDVWSSK